MLLVKSWPMEPLVYAAIVAGLLSYRFIRKLSRQPGARAARA